MSGEVGATRGREDWVLGEEVGESGETSGERRRGGGGSGGKGRGGEIRTGRHRERARRRVMLARDRSLS